MHRHPPLCPPTPSPLQQCQQEGLHLTQISLKPGKTNSQKMQGDSTLRLCRFHSEVATSHQDVTILRQVGTHPGFQVMHHSDRATLFCRQRVAFTQQATSKAYFQMASRAIISEPGLKSEKPKYKCSSAYWPQSLLRGCKHM